tara:strand:- start:3916 stop:4287 length:372 start_codon:yes stop_codon:yes gene_type:complete
MKVPERVVLSAIPLIDDFAQLFSLTISKKIYKRETRVLLDYLMLVGVCWNVADVTKKKNSIIAGILKGALTLFMGYLLMHTMLDDVVTLVKGRYTKMMLGIFFILCVATAEYSVWSLLEKQFD